MKREKEKEDEREEDGEKKNGEKEKREEEEWRERGKENCDQVFKSGFSGDCNVRQKRK